MSNVLWEWNKLDVSQFDTGSFYTIRNGSAGPFTGSVSLTTETIAGNPCLKLFGQFNSNKGILFKASGLSLPERYQVEFEIISKSFASTPAADNEFQVSVALFGSFDSDQNYFLASQNGGIIYQGSRSSTNVCSISSVKEFSSMAYFRAIVDYRPTASYPSASYFVMASLPDDDNDGSQVNETVHSWKAAGNLFTSSWAGSEMDGFGIGVGNFAIANSVTGAVWITNIRILKHPLDLEFDNF